MRWSTWLILLALTLAPAVAWAGKPLVEIDISVDGAKVSVDGRVKFPKASKREHIPLSEGTHSLRVDKPGFATVQRTLDVDADSPDSLRVRVELKGGKSEPAPVAEEAPAKRQKSEAAPEEKPGKAEVAETEGAAKEKSAAKEKAAEDRAERRKKRKAEAAERAKERSELAEKKKAERRKAERTEETDQTEETTPPAEEPLAAPRTSLVVQPPPPAPAPTAVPFEQRPPQTPLTVAVLDYAGFDSDARVAGVMSDAVAAEIRKYDRVSAIGSKDIKKLLSKKQLYDLAGCDNDRCRAAIGASLGVDDVVVTELKQDKDTSKVQMRRIDVKSGITIAVAATAVDGSRLSPFDAVGPDVHTLYGDYPLRAGQKAGVTRAVIIGRLRPPPPLPTSVFISTATIAGAALLTGGVFALEFATTQAQYRSVVNSTGEAPVSAASINALAGKMKLDASVTNIALIAGGALAVGAFVEIFFTDWKGISQAAAPPVMQDPGPDDVSLRLTPTGLLVSWK